MGRQELGLQTAEAAEKVLFDVDPGGDAREGGLGATTMLVQRSISIHTHTQKERERERDRERERVSWM